MNQVVLAAVVPRHRRERFPIDAFFVNAQAAPCRFILEHLMSKLIDSGTRLARTGVARDEPAATELISFPSQSTELRAMVLRGEASKSRNGNNQQQNSKTQQDSQGREFCQQIGRKRDRANRHEEELFHGHTFPMR